MATIANLLVENLFRTVLTGEVSIGDSVLPVAQVQGFPDPLPGEYFYVSVLDSQGNLEIVKIGEVSGLNLILFSGATMTKAFSSADARVESWFVAEILRDIQTYLESLDEVVADEATLTKVGTVLSILSVPFATLPSFTPGTILGRIGPETDGPPSLVSVATDLIASAPATSIPHAAAAKAYPDFLFGNLISRLQTVIQNHVDTPSNYTNAPVVPAYTLQEIETLTTTIVPVSPADRVRVDIRMSFETTTNSVNGGVFILRRKIDNGAWETIGNAVEEAVDNARVLGFAPIPYDAEITNTMSHISLSYLDSPNTTNEVQYGVFFAVQDNRFALNRTISDTNVPSRERATSSMILTEVLTGA